MLNLIATSYLEKEADLKSLLLSNVDDVAKAGYNGLKSISGKILPGLKQAGDDIVQAGKTVANRRAKQIADAASPAINAVDDAVTRGKNALYTLKGNVTGKTAEDFANLAISESAIKDYYKNELARVTGGQSKVNNVIANLVKRVRDGRHDAAIRINKLRGANKGLKADLNAVEDALNATKASLNQANKATSAAQAERDGFRALYEEGKRTAAKAAKAAQQRYDDAINWGNQRVKDLSGKMDEAKKAATAQDQKGRLKLKGALQALKNERLKKNLAYAGIPTAGITGFGISRFSDKNEG